MRVEVDERPEAVDLLADDLRILTGLRSRTAVRDRPLPSLDIWLDDPENIDDRYSQLRTLIHGAIDAIPDPDHRRAASILLSFDEGRWRPLTRRGADAAAVFGLGWDAYRRRRDTTGASLLQETLLELATALAYHAGGTASRPLPADGTTAPGGTNQLAHDDDPSGVRWHRPALVAAFILLLGVGGFALGRTQATGATSAAQSPRSPDQCGNLTHQIGALSPASDPELGRWVEPFRQAAADLPDQSVRCASLIQVEGGHVLQRISEGNGSGVGALVAAPDAPGGVVVMAHFEFTAFTHGELEAEDPENRLGVPVRRADRDDGIAVIETATGAIVQERELSPAYWVTERFWREWNARGGLDGEAGRPLTQAYGVSGSGTIQFFEGGRLIADYRSGEIRWEPATPTDQALPDRFLGAVLVSTNGYTSWFVDLDGTRHWLPTDSDFGCAREAHQANEIRDVSPIAIASLPAGRPFRCR